MTLDVVVSPSPVAASAAADQAISRALLERVAAGELDSAVRVWAPVPALALSRLDELRPGAVEARAAAARAGIEPVVRVSGGHAVVLGPGSMCVGFAERAATFEGTQARYERLVAALVAALGGLGIDAEQGELDGEWCPGAWSIRAGEVKLAGLAQRAVKGAAWAEAVVRLGPDPDGDKLLAEVYDALGLYLNPVTLGCVIDLTPSQVSFEDLAERLLQAL